MAEEKIDRKQLLNEIVEAFKMKDIFDEKVQIKFGIFSMLITKVPKEEKEAVMDQILELFDDEEIIALHQDAKEGKMKP